MSDIVVTFCVGPESITGRITKYGLNTHSVHLRDAMSVAELFSPNKLHPSEWYDYFATEIGEEDDYFYQITIMDDGEVVTELDMVPFDCKLDDMELAVEYARARIEANELNDEDDIDNERAYAQAIHDMRDEWNDV